MRSRVVNVSDTFYDNLRVTNLSLFGQSPVGTDLLVVPVDTALVVPETNYTHFLVYSRSSCIYIYIYR